MKNETQEKEIAVFIDRRGKCVNVRWLSDENYNNIERITREEVTYKSAIAEFDNDEGISEVYGHVILNELKSGIVYIYHNDGNSDDNLMDEEESAPTIDELIFDHWNHDGERTIRLTLTEAEEQRANWCKLDEFLTA